MSERISTNVVLVTGANGFIAGHIIKQLLGQNYTVRGTVRNLANHTAKYKYLYDLQTAPNQLQLYLADLCSDDNWDTIINGCTYIIHVAGPVPKRHDTRGISDEQMMSVTVHGLLQILRMSLQYKQQIKRFVLTSGDSVMFNAPEMQHRMVKIIRNTDWSDETCGARSAYDKAKIVTEKSFWKFLSEHGDPFEGVSINPSMVIGPLLNENEPGSIGTISALLNGEFPFLPNCGFMFVDVRDVAQCHVNALTASNISGKRYVVGHHFLWLSDVAKILHGQFAGYRSQIPLAVQYDVVWKLIGKFDSVINEFVVPSLGKLYIARNEDTVRDLNVAFRSLNESVIDCADSLIKFGLATKPSTTKNLMRNALKGVIFGVVIGAVVYCWQTKPVM